MVFFYSNPNLIENKSDETEKALFYIQVSIYPRSSYKTLKEKQAQGDASVYELAEFKDSQGRLWVSSGPVWGQGDSSNYTVETNYKDKYYHISSQAYGKNLEKYLKKELIIQMAIHMV